MKHVNSNVFRWLETVRISGCAYEYGAKECVTYLGDGFGGTRTYIGQFSGSARAEITHLLFR